MASDISGQNSSTIVSNFFRAKTFSSGIGSSKREIIPAEKSKFLLTTTVEKNNFATVSKNYFNFFMSLFIL